MLPKIRHPLSRQLRKLNNRGNRTNCVTLSGALVERKELRFTPAAVPVLECLIEHHSEQEEAGHPRQIECLVPAIALGEITRVLLAAELGMVFEFTGFLAKTSSKSGRLRLHITRIEIIEGNENGKVLQEEG